MTRITRRQFITSIGALAACGIGAAASLLGKRWWERTVDSADGHPPITPPDTHSIEASHYVSFASEGSQTCSSCHNQVDETLPVSYCHIPHTGSYVRCNLCPHACIIAEGQRGDCRVRENRNGRLYSRVYGNPCAVHIDPIEKKPFYHFLPHAATFSLATAGCNLRCLYCQNWSISQRAPEDTQNVDLPPREVVDLAQKNNAPIIAYTYSEPIVFYEYMLATSRLSREAGLLNVVISAGFIETDPLRNLCQWVDAIKIDLKGYDEDFYRDVVGGELQPVLRAIETIHESGVHIEIVNLVVPTLNDDLEQLRQLARWVAQDLDPDVPLHFSRFHPEYKLANLPPTPVDTLDKAREMALQEGVRYVYIGNVPGHPGNHTYCHACGLPIILRQGYAVQLYEIEDGFCKHCRARIPGVWWSEESSWQLDKTQIGMQDQSTLVIRS